MSAFSVKFLCIEYGVGFGIALLTFVLLRAAFAVYRCRLFGYIYWGICMLTAVCALAVFMKTENLFTSAAALRLVTIWLLTQLALIVLLSLIWSGKRLWRFCFQNDMPQDISRRAFIKCAAVGIPGTVLGVNFYGAWNAATHMEFRELNLTLPRLPAELDGYRLAQLSDVHLGLFFSPTQLDTLLKDIIAKQPDVLVITGDLIDDVAMAEEMAAVLEAHIDSFPDGIWFVWGNHEYFRDFTRIESALQATRVRILRNRQALLKDAATPLYFLGVDYPWERENVKRGAECQSMLEEASADIPADSIKILLTHHPDIIKNAFAAGIDLTLAGHTHGGQIELFGVSLLPAHYDYLRGLYKENACYAYVNSGAGSWCPVRIGCPAEAVVFTLRGVQ